MGLARHFPYVTEWEEGTSWLELVRREGAAAAKDTLQYKAVEKMFDFDEVEWTAEMFGEMIEGADLMKRELEWDPRCKNHPRAFNLRFNLFEPLMLETVAALLQSEFVNLRMITLQPSLPIEDMSSVDKWVPENRAAWDIFTKLSQKCNNCKLVLEEGLFLADAYAPIVCEWVIEVWPLFLMPNRDEGTEKKVMGWANKTLSHICSELSSVDCFITKKATLPWMIYDIGGICKYLCTEYIDITWDYVDYDYKKDEYVVDRTYRFFSHLGPDKLHMMQFRCLVNLKKSKARLDLKFRYYSNISEDMQRFIRDNAQRKKSSVKVRWHISNDPDYRGKYTYKKDPNTLPVRDRIRVVLE